MTTETQKKTEQNLINFVTEITPDLVDRVAERVYRQWLRDARRERERLARMKR